MGNKIQLSHGAGGTQMYHLIDDLIIKTLGYKKSELRDAEIIRFQKEFDLGFTTDSYVVNPIFFPGGDIGKLCVAGTVNDLIVSGAMPLNLSLGLILEEGLDFDDLEKILISIREYSELAGVKIITGDTKVVGRGMADSIFINTAGIGFIDDEYMISPDMIKEGDAVIINGPIADHGIAILSQRDEFDFKTDIESDCAPLSMLVSDIKKTSKRI